MGPLMGKRTKVLTMVQREVEEVAVYQTELREMNNVEGVAMDTATQFQ